MRSPHAVEPGASGNALTHRGPFAEVRSFLKRHWPQVLLALPMAAAITVGHEAAHAGAVLIQGGRIVEFSWLPNLGEWGHVRYTFPPGVAFSSQAIGLAPYCLWLSVAATAAGFARVPKPMPQFLAATVFVWLFVAPLADIANTAFPYLLGAANDFRKAFGAPSALAWMLVAAGSVLAAVVGFAVQRHLYRDHALSVPAYAILCGATIGGLAALSALDRLWRAG